MLILADCDLDAQPASPKTVFICAKNTITVTPCVLSGSLERVKAKCGCLTERRCLSRVKNRFRLALWGWRLCGWTIPLSGGGGCDGVAGVRYSPRRDLRRSGACCSGHTWGTACASLYPVTTPFQLRERDKRGRWRLTSHHRRWHHLCNND